MQTALHPDVTADQAIAATGWPLRLAETLEVTDPPTANELAALAALRAA